MTDRIALIADGRLVLTGMDGKPAVHDCQFALDMERRQQQTVNKNAWLNSGGGDEGMFSRSTVWGSRASGRAPGPKPRIVAVAGGDRPESMVYSLWTGSVGAFLDFDFDEKYERRVFHRENFNISEIDRNPTCGRLLCRLGEGMESSIALLDADGRNARVITEGDSTDGAPSWVPQSSDELVYHSAGISRDPGGYVRGLAPFVIHRLDLTNANLQTLAESPDHDLLAPKIGADGSLYFIRRPYEGPEGKRPSPWLTLKDTLLFPFRLFRTFIDFFQIFSQMVSRKPLSTAGNTRMQGPEPVKLWIHGRLLEIGKDSAKAHPEGALAPADWVLVRKSPDGQETVLAKHVVAYDLSSDGRIAWSDGRNVHLFSNGRSEKLTSEAMISTVKWIEPLAVPSSEG
jgi:hypothetical protein